MIDQLKKYCSQTIPFDEAELDLIDKFFEEKLLKKKEFLLRESSICNFIGFIAKGCIRHFHIQDGIERTCDISFENAWITDFQSFTTETRSVLNFQALKNTTVYLINKKSLNQLYAECPKYETFGRIMTEQIVKRVTEMSMSLSSQKPEERYQNLLEKQPDLFQKVPQKYIANMLGILPESLSRIRKRLIAKQKS